MSTAARRIPRLALPPLQRTTVVGAVLFALLFAAPVAYGDDFRLQQFDYILSLTLIAIGLNIVTGFAGQLALGPGGIFGIGGYAAAVLANDHPQQVGLVVMCVMAVLAASVAGLLVGVPALRVGGFYLGMATLAVAIMVPVVGHELKFTGGNTGVSLLSLPDFSPNLTGVALYEVTVAVVLVVTIWSWAVLRSRVGHRFLALANSEDLAASLGIAGFRTKLVAFVLSAWPAGLGGAFYVYSQQFFTSSSADSNLSIYVLAACVIGGFGSVLGPIFGGLLVFGLNQFLGSFQQWQGIIFGVLLAGFAIVWPEGIMGFVEGTGGRRPLPWTTGVRRALNLRRTSVDHGERRPRRERAASAAPSAASTAPSAASTAPSAATPAPAPAAPALPVQAVAPDGAASDTPHLQVRRAVRSFGGVRAVAEVDLSIRRGTVHALIGSNGSGKTTLLNLISGFYRLDAGEIWLGGERLDSHSAAEVATLGVGRTFQTPKLLARETLLQNVVTAAEVTAPCRGASSVLRLPSGLRADRAAREIARAAIAEVGLEEYADAPTGRLPHGLRRLGEIARCLAMSPSVLLLDEPAAGLTHTELDRLDEVVRRAAASGMAVLLVEHNVPFVFGLADEVTVLHMGQVIAHGTPAEIRDDEDVARSFLGSQAEQVRAARPVETPSEAPHA